jgi:hypothetical protein
MIQLCLYLLHQAYVMRMYEEVKVHFHPSRPRHKMEVIGQFQFRSLYLLGNKTPNVCWIGLHCGSQNQPRFCGEGTNLLPLPGIVHRPSSPYPIAIYIYKFYSKTTVSFGLTRDK